MSCSFLDPALVQGVVLAGAYPRGRSLFDRLRPRPLLPVAQTPLAAYPLRWLSASGTRNVSLCANSSARSLRGCLCDETDLPREITFYEDWMPRGTAGCVRDVGLRTPAHTLVVVDGTTVPCLDLAELLEAHQASHAAVTVVAHCEGGPASSRNALNPCGVYVFDRRAINFVSPCGYQDIKETLIPKLHSAGEHVEVHLVSRACPPVLDAETYLAVNRWMISHVVAEGLVPRGYRVMDGGLVHATAQIAEDARVLGPVMLGPDVVIEEDVTLVGPTAIGPGSRVARSAVVSRSVAWSRCWFGPDSLVDRCLLSDYAVVSPGSSLYNMLKAGVPGRARVRPGAVAAEAALPAEPVPVPDTHW